jgi:hypothetical protein
MGEELGVGCLFGLSSESPPATRTKEGPGFLRGSCSFLMTPVLVRACSAYPGRYRAYTFLTKTSSSFVVS